MRKDLRYSFDASRWTWERENKRFWNAKENVWERETSVSGTSIPPVKGSNLSEFSEDFQNFGWLLSVRISKWRRLQSVLILDLNVKNEHIKNLSFSTVFRLKKRLRTHIQYSILGGNILSFWEVKIHFYFNRRTNIDKMD